MTFDKQQKRVITLAARVKTWVEQDLLVTAKQPGRNNRKWRRGENTLPLDDKFLAHGVGNGPPSHH